MVLPEGCNTEWVVSQLDKFIRITDGKFVSGLGGEFDPMWDSDFGRDEILDEVVIVEEIFDAFCPGWKCEEGDCSLADHDENPWKEYRDLALRVRSFARCSDSIQQNLGNSAPVLRANDLHPWIWQAAQAFWSIGHYGEAVEAACKRLNAEMQNKVGRRDVSETSLFNECFSDDDPKPGRPRLRFSVNAEGRTAQSMRRGVRAYAEGVFAAIRNPLAHEYGVELAPQVALEYLVTLSVLARWVDEASVCECGGADAAR